MEVAGLNVDVMVKKLGGDDEEGGGTYNQEVKVSSEVGMVYMRGRRKKMGGKGMRKRLSDLVRFQHCSTQSEWCTNRPTQRPNTCRFSIFSARIGKKKPALNIFLSDPLICHASSAWLPALPFHLRPNDTAITRVTHPRWHVTRVMTIMSHTRRARYSRSSFPLPQATAGHPTRHS